MTAKSALCQYLLSGKVLNVKNCFTIIGLTNASREVSRMIEKEFDVEVTRTSMTGVSRYGQAVTWFNYKLEHTELNRPGIDKMREYLRQNSRSSNVITTTVKEHVRILKREERQPELFS